MKKKQLRKRTDMGNGMVTFSINFIQGDTGSMRFGDFCEMAYRYVTQGRTCLIAYSGVVVKTGNDMQAHKPIFYTRNMQYITLQWILLTRLQRLFF